MELKDVKIIPGYFVKQNPDGSIKAKVPGVFNNTDDVEKWPNIYPWHNGGMSGTYSKLKEGDIVWVLFNKTNKEELFWLRKDIEFVEPKITDNLLSEDNMILEVLCQKEMKNGETAALYLTDDDGWLLTKGDTKIHITSAGNITLSNGMDNRTVDIGPEGISLGSLGTSAHPAVKGDVLVKVLLSLTRLLKQVELACSMNPYTVAVGNVIKMSLPAISDNIPSITSSNVTLD